MEPAKAIENIARSLEVDPDDLTIEIRKDGRTTIVAHVAKERIVLAMLRSFEELRPYVEGLTTPRNRLINVVSTDERTTATRS